MGWSVGAGDAFIIPVAATLFDLVPVFHFFFIDEKFIDAEIEDEFITAGISSFRDTGIGGNQFGFAFAGTSIVAGDLRKSLWLLGAASLPIGPGCATAVDAGANDIEFIDGGAGQRISRPTAGHVGRHIGIVAGDPKLAATKQNQKQRR